MAVAAGGSSFRAAIGVMFVALTAARPASQSPPPRDTLAAELARVVAVAIAPQVRVTLEAGADPLLDAAIVDQLTARGVQVVTPGDGVPSLRVSCFDNLRERACAAELAGTARRTILVTDPHARTPSPSGDRLDLQLRPLVAQETPILDVARDDDDLLVLTRDAMLRYRLRDGSWTRENARPIVHSRPWPRDVRGRVRLADGRVQAFLPGVTCSGSVDSAAMTCAAQDASWPLEIEGARLEAGRNHFTAAGGLTFLGVARLGGDAGSPWLAATLDHRLAFVDDSRRVVPSDVFADDVASVRTRCATAQHVLASTSDGDEDTVTLFRVVRRQLIPAASAVRLPGELTALWPSASGEAATIITRDRDAGRYVAHELTLSCSR